MISKLFEFINAPQNYEIIQQENEFAEIEICGSFIDDDNDDTEQDMPFAFSKTCFRIVNEENGEAVTPFVFFEGTENICYATAKVPVGGPYAVEILYLDAESSTEYYIRGDKRRHFYVGDVFLIAGQSNAIGMGLGRITEIPEMGVHIFRNLQYWDIASSPFNDFDYAKQSLFMSFAKKLKRATGRPIGLIPGAIGGASISRWMPEENGDLYEKMMETIKRKGIEARAVLWYQGCAEAGKGVSTEAYIDAFEKVVSAFRADMEKPDMKVFTFQLNRQILTEPDEEFDGFYDNIREAQRQAAKKIRNVYVLPTADASIMADFIHSGKPSNIMLGERMALQVLDKEYGIGAGADAPEIKSAKLLDAQCIELEFDNVTSFLYEYNAPKSELPIAVSDKNGRAKICDYKISANKITVFTERKLEGEVFVGGQTGTDPKRVIVDYDTQIAMLCFKNFKVEE